MPQTTKNRSRRLPTTEQLVVWRAFTETSEIIRSRAGSQLQHAANLSIGDYQVLLALTEAAENRLRPSEIADAINWERSRLSHHLGRMEKRGLVAREQCAEDNRGSDVVLTEAGRQAFRAGSIPHLETVRELFIDALTPEQLALMAELISALRDHLALPPLPGELRD